MFPVYQPCPGKQTATCVIYESDVSLYQGIAQLLIIIRVARGRAITSEQTRAVVACTTMAFSATVSDETEDTNIERTAGSEKGGSSYPVVSRSGEGG
jgi:hypothetical protein